MTSSPWTAAEPITSLFRASHPDLWKQSQFFTKWVPMPGPMPRKTVEAAVDKRLRRMVHPPPPPALPPRPPALKLSSSLQGTDRLDLLQFHWWDYKSADQYMEALGHMQVRHKKGLHGHAPNLKRPDLTASRRATCPLFLHTTSSLEPNSPTLNSKP